MITINKLACLNRSLRYGVLIFLKLSVECRKQAGSQASRRLHFGANRAARLRCRCWYANRGCPLNPCPDNETDLAGFEWVANAWRTWSAIDSTRRWKEQHPFVYKPGINTCLGGVNSRSLRKYVKLPGVISEFHNLRYRSAAVLL